MSRTIYGLPMYLAGVVVREGEEPRFGKRRHVVQYSSVHGSQTGRGNRARFGSTISKMV